MLLRRKFPLGSAIASGCHGTPFCITVDHQTLEDNSVTVRYRDTMEQEHVNIDSLHHLIGDAVNMKICLKIVS